MEMPDVGGQLPAVSLTAQSTDRAVDSSRVSRPEPLGRPAKRNIARGADRDGEVLAREWLSPPGKTAGRRVSIVREDFKYPFLRKVEELQVDPVTGEKRVRLLSSSVADHVIVGLKEGVTEHAARHALERSGFGVRAVEPGSFMLVEIENFAELEAQGRAIAALASLEEFIEFSEPDYLVWPALVPDDPAYAAGLLWGLDNPGLSGGAAPDADIDAPEAWGARTDASSVVVAVTDTGIRYTHEDLAANMWVNAGEVPGDGIDNDGNGIVDDVHGFDAQFDDGDPDDAQGHGTHVAGIVGARGNNGVGTVGVAWSVQLMAGKFLSGAGGTSSDAVRVINYARLNGADIINASWGGLAYSTALYNAIRACGDEGILLVAAAGNQANDNDAHPYYPAAFQLPNVVSVASTDQGGRLSPFTNTGRYSVGLAAPGSKIWSTFNRSDDDYRLVDGTSMAAPHVSGALALARAEFPGDDAVDLRTRLLSSVDPQPALLGKVAAGGRLNAHRLLTGSSPIPVHDAFDQALRLEGYGGVWTGSNRRASREDDENSFAQQGSGSRSLWFAWTPPHAGLAEFRITSRDGEVLGILYEGGTKAEVTGGEVARMETGDSSRLFSHVEAGREYRLLLDSDTPSGQELHLSVQLLPANDNFQQAEVLNGDVFLLEGSNRGATPQRFERSRPHAGVGQGHSVWWVWEAPSEGPFVIATTESTFDTVLAVYTGHPFDPGGLQEVASNDDRSASDWTSLVEFTAQAGVEYSIVVDSFRAGDGGDVLLQGFPLSGITILRQPQNLQAGFGERASFKVVAHAGGQLGYQWYLDGAPLPGERSAQLVIDPVTPASLGSYEVEVFNQVASVRSELADLSELRTAPVIAWQSGDVSAVSGDPVRLQVIAEGSLPLAYAWSRNGAPLVGVDGPTLEFPAIVGGDAGTYRCQVSNEAGFDSVSFRVSVVNSPIEGWDWRRETHPSGAITDIRQIDGALYAVAGDRVLHSPDGDEWMVHPLPAGFEGQSLVSFDGQFVCGGIDFDGSASLSFSDDGVTWAPPQAITAIDGPHSIDAIGQLEVVSSRAGSRMLMRTSLAGVEQGAVMYSEDGGTWYPSRAPHPGGMIGELFTEARMVRAFGRLYLPGGEDAVLYSNDGIDWFEIEVPGIGAGLAVSLISGKLHLVGTQGISESLNGFDWNGTAVENGANSWEPGSMAFAVGGGVLVLVGDLDYRWGTEIWNADLANLYPNTGGEDFTAGILFGGRVIYGTSHGRLAAVSGPSELTVPPVDAGVVDQLVFVNGEFVASASRFVIGQPTEPVLISGDGRTWRVSRNLGFADLFTPLYYLGNRYFGADTGLGETATGWAPGAVYEDGPGPTHPGPITSVATDGTSTFLVAQDVLYGTSMSGQTWNLLRPAFPMDRIHYFKGKWFLTSSGSNQAMERSQNGVTWEAVPLVSADQIVELGGMLYAIEFEMDRIWKSPDGITWTRYAPTLPATYDTRDDVERVVVFEGAIIILTEDHRLYFSSDGEIWFAVQTSFRFADVAVGNGQLVGLTEDGGIVQAGRDHPGGRAPLVHIERPIHMATRVRGSVVDISGTATDPEGQPVEIECLVDGQSIGTSGNPSFSFRFDALESGLRQVVVRATDAQGLVGSDELAMIVEQQDLPNSLTGGGIDTAVPNGFWFEFGGALYAAGDRVLFRSLDGEEWEKVDLQSGSRGIFSVATGNGALVIQFSDAALATTTDGVNWVRSAPSPGSEILAPLTFMNGRFVTTTGSSVPFSVLQHSKDGVNWHLGRIGAGNYKDVVMSIGGVVLGLDRLTVWRSIDEGLNRREVEGLNLSGAATMTTGEGLVVVAGADGRIFVSDDTGASWTLTQQVDPIPPELLSNQVGMDMESAHHAGLFLIGAEEEWLYVSEDGRSWHPLLGEPLPDSRIIAFGGGYLATGFDGLLESIDGIQWQAVEGAPPNAVGATLISSGGVAMVSDSNGGLWRSGDGSDWEHVLPGDPLSNGLGIPRTVTSLRLSESFGGRMIVGGSDGILWFSDDEGGTWEQGSFHGGPMPTNRIYTDLGVGTESLVAVGSRGAYRAELVWSTDGADWKRLRDFRNRNVTAAEGWNREFLVGCADGALWRSVDAGQSWAEVPRLSGLNSVHTILRHPDLPGNGVTSLGRISGAIPFRDSESRWH